MKARKYWIFCLIMTILLAAASAGCSVSPATTPQQTTGTTTPSSEPASDATENATGPSFTIAVQPLELKGFSIAGQQIVYLVTVTDEGQAGGQPVTIAAQADGAKIVLAHEQIIAGEVAEITVIPDAASVGKKITVNFTGRRGNLEDAASVSFEVIEGLDDREDYALELRAKFTAWLAAEHPELGINADTVWSGTMVSPQWLVVSHYLFFSDEWEMHVEWHVMIAPYDWVRIDLRHRYDETKPSYAFEISSISAANVPIAIEVPGEIWR